MRLTHINNGKFALRSLNNEEELVANKLGQLEDLEQELGIDLFTYVKLTTTTKLYFHNIPYDDEIKEGYLININAFITNPKIYCLLLQDKKKNRYMFSLKDYKKTWALTKEELYYNE